jgi:hypothetical protein
MHARCHAASACRAPGCARSSRPCWREPTTFARPPRVAGSKTPPARVGSSPSRNTAWIQEGGRPRCTWPGRRRPGRSLGNIDASKISLLISGLVGASALARVSQMDLKRDFGSISLHTTGDAHLDHLVEAIQNYLSRHPDAGDSELGIAQWWLYDWQRPAGESASTDHVRQALECLQQHGEVEALMLGGGRLWRATGVKRRTT